MIRLSYLSFFLASFFLSFSLPYSDFVFLTMVFAGHHRSALFLPPTMASIPLLCPLEISWHNVLYQTKTASQQSLLCRWTKPLKKRFGNLWICGHYIPGNGKQIHFWHLFHPRSTAPELREATLVLKRVCLDNSNYTINAWCTGTAGNHKNLFQVPYTNCSLYMTVFFLPCRDFKIVSCHM